MPSVAPNVSVEEIKPLQQVLKITNPETPDSKEMKKAGIIGAQVFRFIGEEAPESFNDYSFVGTAKRFKYTTSFSEKDQGSRVFYALRYENTRGETGPWSTVISSVIA